MSCEACRDGIALFVLCRVIVLSIVKRMIKKAVQDTGSFFKGSLFAIRTLCEGKRTKFKDKTDKDILLCGNGPSLSRIDLEKAKKRGIEIACVSFFPSKNKDFFRVKPGYLFLIDPLFFDYRKVYAKDDPAYIEMERLYEALQKVDWEMKLVVRQGNHVNIDNVHIKVEYLSQYSYFGQGAEHYLDYLYKRDLVILGAQNVCVSALFYFINITSGTIYLSGLDMSEFTCLAVDEDNDVYVETVHSYGVKKVSLNKQFQYKKGELYKKLAVYQRTFEQFYYLSGFAERMNRKVINLAPDSYLDVFEKKVIKELEAD